MRSVRCPEMLFVTRLSTFAARHVVVRRRTAPSEHATYLAKSSWYPDEGREMLSEDRGEQSAFDGEPEMQPRMSSACREMQSAFGQKPSEHRKMHSAFGGKLSVLRGCRSRLQAVLYGFGLSLCALRRMLSALRLFLSSFRSRLSALAATPSEEQGQRYEGRATPCPKLAMPSPNLAMLCPYLGVLSRFVMILCEGAAPIREQSRGYRAFRPMLPSSRKGLCALVEMQSEREATPRACLGVHLWKLATPCV
jgi:hypothetical protein